MLNYDVAIKNSGFMELAILKKNIWSKGKLWVFVFLYRHM